MQGYYVEAEDTSADLDWEATMAYVADMKRYHAPPLTLKDCRNPLCTHQSYAVYCGTYCQEAIEGTEEPVEADDFYHDESDQVTLGHIATADQQWEQDQAAGDFVGMVCGVQAQPTAPAVPTFTEAPISCTVKGFRHGQDCMITIRGTDFATVQAQLDAATQWFDAPAAATQSATQETGVDVCAIHQVRMKLNHGKDGSTWYSHRLGEGEFCKGKPKGQVRHGY